MTSRATHWPALLVAATVGLVVAASSPAWADSVRDKQWHLSTLRVSETHTASQGDGVTVAVIDTGVDANHPDLTGNVLPGVDLTASGGDGRVDPSGHGTAMASDIAAHGHGPGNMSGALGLAPKAKILPVRFSTGNTDGDLGAGIRWAVDHGAKILNVSSVGPDLSSFRDATTYALGKGAIIVAGTGNTGKDVGAPAQYPGVVAVGGVDRDGGHWALSSHGRETVITAPAVDIVSAKTGGGYFIENGTSDATALVSATVALIWSKYPQLDANNVIARLISTADDRGEPGRDPLYGYGVVNPHKAVTADVPAVTANPLISAPSSAPSPPTASAPPSGPSAGTAKGKAVSPGTVVLVVGAMTAALVLIGVAIGVSVVRRRGGRDTARAGSWPPAR
ncbi:S8 family serine peptidase [Longispora urticae]